MTHRKSEPPEPEDQWASFAEHQELVKASEEFLRRLAAEERRPPPVGDGRG